MTKLLETSIIDVAVKADVVWVIVENREDVEPAEGADCARRMADLLVAEILVPSSPYLGVIMDVRRGPVVFGPNTRDVMERAMRAAQEHGVRVAVVVEGTTQRMQFDSMTGIYAPDVGSVFESESPALAFISARA